MQEFLFIKHYKTRNVNEYQISLQDMIIISEHDFSQFQKYFDNIWKSLGKS